MSFLEIEEDIKNNLAPEEKDEFNKFIEIASQLSYNKNIEEENDKIEKEELELLLLKQRILVGWVIKNEF